MMINGSLRDITGEQLQGCACMVFNRRARIDYRAGAKLIEYPVHARKLIPGNAKSATLPPKHRLNLQSMTYLSAVVFGKIRHYASMEVDKPNGDLATLCRLEPNQSLHRFSVRDWRRCDLSLALLGLKFRQALSVV